MAKYIFILGSSPELAKQELASFFDLKPNKIANIGQDIALIENDQDPQKMIDILGGTVKIGQFIETIDVLDELVPEKWQSYFQAPILQKFTFGFSLYGGAKNDYQSLLRLAMDFKKYLKQTQKQPARLVTGREADLSSVIVTKNNLLGRELLIIKNENKWLIGLTQAVQAFEEYAARDMDRPHRDSRSGMLPPKVARMMINLAGSDHTKTILDPFCGSGTILQEAYALGFSNIIGRDLSPKAVFDTKDNLDWLAKKTNQQTNLDIKKGDVRFLSDHVNVPVDLIVTEPFMGDSRRLPTPDTIRELQKLYQTAFQQFSKILSKNGQIIFIFPIFNIGAKKIATLDLDGILSLGFKIKGPTIVYSRSNQRVFREITVFTK